ncbi:MAG: CRTAC1 family protein [Gemmatimonadales bacterium]
MPDRFPRRAVLNVVFVAAIGLVVALDRRGRSAAGDSLEPGFTLANVASQVGIDFVHLKPTLDPKLDNVAPHVAGLGASVSVADVNRDGWPDLYFTNSRFGHPNALYLNQRDATFRDEAAAMGVADLNREGEGVSMGSVWGDYDNDGFEDLLIYKWGYLQLLRNVGGERFEDVTDRAGLRRWMNANSAVWLDYDRDGLLDLYVGGYFRSEIDMWNITTTRIMQNSFEFATNGGKNILFHNRGDGEFEDVTDAMGVGSTRWTLAVAAADFNEDGWPDLYLANDYGPEEYYVNRRAERFVLTRAGLEDDSKSGMSVSLGDLMNRGRFDVFVTNISERGYLFQGNNLRLNFLDELGRFEEVAQGVVADAGWAWGAQFGDLNNDGQLDLFVLNGFISADRDRDYWYGMSKVAGAASAIFEDAANWPPIGTASLSGYERSRLLMNRDGELVDVAQAAGVTDEFDGRAVAFADLFNRGVLDVIVANQEGPALIYRNSVDPDRHWIAFELEGTVSNRSAIGAELIVTFNGMKQRHIVDGGMGFASQNDRRIHVGLGPGSASRVSRVVIHWPSGIDQTIQNPAIDRLHRITEPSR